MTGCVARRLPRLAGLLLAATLLASPALAQEIVLNLRDVDIRAFIEDVSKATGRTFIVDPRVTGKVTVLSQRPLGAGEVFEVFQSTLRSNGFIAVPTAQGAFRIVPEEQAAREPAAGSGAAVAENRFVTEVIPLRFATATSVATAIKPMLSERGQATVNSRGNAVVVVDFGATVARVRQVVRELDQDRSDYRTLTLRNSSATEMARVATALAAEAGGEPGQAPLAVVVPVVASNALVLKGDQRLLSRLIPVLEALDVQASAQDNIRVVALRHANAEELVPILQQVSAALLAGDGKPDPATPRRANIASHKATNALIISADSDTQKTLEAVVQKLDVPRRQVMVEAIIVEVSDTAARELGVQFVLAGNGSNAVPFVSNTTSGSAPNVLAITGALLLEDRLRADEDSQALENLRAAAINSLLGVNGFGFGAAGRTSDGNLFGFILRALKEDIASNVLSTPSVMTLDNEKASILVGQQIPITTGETLSATNTNPFRTIRREDVGVQLDVVPQINEGGQIRLTIRQEVSSIFGPVTPSSTDLITNRRAINTTVTVADGEIVVLGGLIQDDQQKTRNGIPLLGDLPGVGRLFRTEGTSRRKTNLMVFLRPTIVTDPAVARAVTARSYDVINARQIVPKGDTETPLDRTLREVLEAQPPRRPAPAPTPALPAPAGTPDPRP